MVCLRNINVDTLHKGDTEEDDDDNNDDDDDNNNNNNNNNNKLMYAVHGAGHSPLSSTEFNEWSNAFITVVRFHD
jgi:hypothetical protein